MDRSQYGCVKIVWTSGEMEDDKVLKRIINYFSVPPLFICALFQVWTESNGNMPAQVIMLAMYINLQMGEYSIFSAFT